MPIYEYSCRACKCTFTVLCPMAARPEQPPCESCGKPDTHRRVSRVRTIRSEEAIMEGLADPSVLSGLDENDPRTIARWAKKMAREMGEDIGDEIENMAEEEIRKAESHRPGEDAGDAGVGPDDSLGGPGACGPMSPPPDAGGGDD